MKNLTKSNACRMTAVHVSNAERKAICHGLAMQLEADGADYENGPLNAARSWRKMSSAFVGREAARGGDVAQAEEIKGQNDRIADLLERLATRTSSLCERN